MTRFDENTAEAMFDELGYHKKIEAANLLEYTDALGKTIRFNKPATMVEKFVKANDYDDCHYAYGIFTRREIIAISQQFIELGVLDGELLEKKVK